MLPGKYMCEESYAFIPQAQGTHNNSMSAVTAVKKAFRKTVKQSLRNLNGEAINRQCKFDIVIHRFIRTAIAYNMIR